MLYVCFIARPTAMASQDEVILCRYYFSPFRKRACLVVSRLCRNTNFDNPTTLNLHGYPRISLRTRSSPPPPSISSEPGVLDYQNFIKHRKPRQVSAGARRQFSQAARCSSRVEFVVELLFQATVRHYHTNLVDLPLECNCS